MIRTFRRAKSVFRNDYLDCLVCFLQKEQLLWLLVVMLEAQPVASAHPHTYSTLHTECSHTHRGLHRERNYVFTKLPSSSHTIRLSLSERGGDVTGPCKQTQHEGRNWGKKRRILWSLCVCVCVCAHSYGRGEKYVVVVFAFQFHWLIKECVSSTLVPVASIPDIINKHAEFPTHQRGGIH